mmetsp:Transcript_32154/g.77769  ORF Transcript_32154/g.77769 Transcript_32154/m.77769 type:complete len:304 (-) Transcript_32154:124-1035(-)
MQLGSFGAAISDGLSRPEARQSLQSLDDFVRGLRRGGAGSLACLLCGTAILLAIIQVVFRDDRVAVPKLIPAGSLCATQDDMYDDRKALCQMGNTYAYAYLMRHDWVMCAPNMPGAKILRGMQDKYGNFWYKSSSRGDVREFYNTCVPTCADDRDTYHSSKKMCLVGNDVARVWLQGDGQSCAHGTAGGQAVRHASAVVGDGNMWYRPQETSRVRELYKSCQSTCAKGDSYVSSEHCEVQDRKALAFLRGDGGYVCDDASPGRSSLKMERGGTRHTRFWYSRAKGAKVEAWYTSCMKQGGFKE